MSLKQAIDLSFLLYFFETDIGEEHLRRIFKKLFNNIFFLRNHLNKLYTVKMENHYKVHKSMLTL